MASPPYRPPPYSLCPPSLPHPVRLEPPFSSISHWALHSFDLYVAFRLQGSPPWAVSGHHNLHFSSRLTLYQSASQPVPFSVSPSDSLFLPFSNQLIPFFPFIPFLFLLSNKLLHRTKYIKNKYLSNKLLHSLCFILQTG